MCEIERERLRERERKYIDAWKERETKIVTERDKDTDIYKDTNRE